MPRATKQENQGPPRPPDMRSIVPRGTRWKMCGRVFRASQAGQPAYACNARVRPGEKLMLHCQKHHGRSKFDGSVPATDCPVAGHDHTDDVLWISPCSWRTLCAKRGVDPHTGAPQRTKHEGPPTSHDAQALPRSSQPPPARRPTRLTPALERAHRPRRPPLPPQDTEREDTRVRVEPPPPLPPLPPSLPATRLPSFRQLLSTLPEEFRRPPSRPHLPSHSAVYAPPVHTPFVVRTGDPWPRPSLCGRFPGTYCLLPECPHARRARR
ncbi:uncharacterized protein PHACADRAFT_29834 [Phanerochaete carnosa HHB-10118-sp]|uniref:Uncharacterized protein n=1 Tax=Phanerochaete carnosa (strain HHB-10118-sp) TaxID=650164 RepID=K5UX20_PHACS|nr:uncharacterized protein PHACADRAFT_29834 [Phanerochaete carnosa HHB-10118-sp]EKM54636.1 hypothetical protein PHACADRAFT_29834 [Phanerochaete carnosa HHB-10118-sp]